MTRYNYNAVETEFYKTDGYASGSDSDIDTTERFSTVITLTIDLGIVLEFHFKEASGASGTDDVQFYVYRKKSGSFTAIENYIDDPLIENDGNETVVTYEIDKPGLYRIGCKSNGGTNTFDLKVIGNYWRLA